MASFQLLPREREGERESIKINFISLHYVYIIHGYIYTRNILLLQPPPKAVSTRFPQLTEVMAAHRVLNVFLETEPQAGGGCWELAGSGSWASHALTRCATCAAELLPRRTASPSCRGKGDKNNNFDLGQVIILLTVLIAASKSCPVFAVVYLLTRRLSGCLQLASALAVHG